MTSTVHTQALTLSLTTLMLFIVESNDTSARQDYTISLGTIIQNHRILLRTIYWIRGFYPLFSAQDPNAKLTIFP